MSGTRYMTLAIGCLGAMAFIMVITALVSLASGPVILYGPRYGHPFATSAVGLYVAVFILGRTAIVAHPAWRTWFLAAPAAMLAGWAIVAGPFHGWLMFAGAVLALPIPWLLGQADPHLFVGLMLVMAPLTVGCLAGLLFYVSARTIAGQSFFDRAARSELASHCLGFALGACLVFLLLTSPDLSPTQISDPIAGLWPLLRLMWPYYLAAPACHLVLLGIGHEVMGRPLARCQPKHLVLICLILFVGIGTARSLWYKDPLMVLTWPATEIKTLGFGFNIPRAPWY